MLNISSSIGWWQGIDHATGFQLVKTSKAAFSASLTWSTTIPPDATTFRL